MTFSSTLVKDAVGMLASGRVCDHFIALIPGVPKRIQIWLDPTMAI